MGYGKKRGGRWRGRGKVVGGGAELRGSRRNREKKGCPPSLCWASGGKARFPKRKSGRCGR